jgi:DNA-binding CsgD family transcriptional regulator/tetratricopeptide (TPR) repeat protein
VRRDAAAGRSLLEREAALAELHGAFDEVRQGEGRFVFVRGEAGIGKTSLVQRFCSEVVGSQVLVGACDPLDTPRPLGPVADMVDQLATAPASLTSDDVPRHERFRAFLEVLSTSRAPVIAFVEDVHWADEATLDLLRFVGRRLAGTGGLLVVTYRDDELTADHPLRTVIGDVIRETTTIAIDLPPLSREAMAHLMAAAGRDDPHEVAELHRLTAGNPFFVTEALTEAEHAVPLTVRDAVLARAGRLDPSTREVLDAAAVLPTRAEVWLLKELVGGDDTQIDACVDAGMLRPDRPGTVAFRHELARQAITDALPPARATTLNLGVATLLVERYGQRVDVARVAHHAAAAGEVDLTRTYAVQAAELATTLGSHREAMAHYEQALRVAVGLGDVELADLLLAFSRSASMVGREEAALEAIHRELALRRVHGDPRALGDVLARQATALLRLGRNPEMDEPIAESREILEHLPPGPELVRGATVAATRASLLGDHESALRLVEEVVALAHELGSAELVVEVGRVMAAARIRLGQTGCKDELRRSIAIATDADLEREAAQGWIMFATAATAERDYPAAAEALDEVSCLAVDRDLDFHREYATALRARLHLEQGDWSRAEELAKQIIDVDEPTGQPFPHIVAQTVLGRLGARRGDTDPWEHLDHIWHLASGTGEPMMVWPLVAARAEAAWLGGARSVADELHGEAAAVVDASRHPWASGEIALWRRRAGTLREVPVDVAEPFALHLAGRSREAADRWEELGCPYEAADALSDGDEARDLRRALDILDDLGAGAAAIRVRRRLRERGERDIPRGPRPATIAHPAGLTPRQAEVLAHLCEGRTDAQIAERLHVSRKTVSHHVSAVIAKLAVRSRTEAAREARRRSLVASEGEPAGPA